MPKQMNILLVEDNDVDAQIVIRGLKKADMTGDLVRARDGREALAVLSRQSGQHPPSYPFLVLLDINMPGMNGHEFLATLRRTPEIAAAQVIVFSTSENPADITRAYDKFASGYLVKPDSGAKMKEVLRTLCDFWQLIAHPPTPSDRRLPARPV